MNHQERNNSLVVRHNSNSYEHAGSTSPNLAALFTACDTMRAVDSVGRAPSFEDTSTSPLALPGPADRIPSMHSQDSGAQNLDLNDAERNSMASSTVESPEVTTSF